MTGRFGPCMAVGVLALGLDLGLARGGLAQDAPAESVEAGLSSQGLYVAPSFALSPNLSLRMPVYVGSLPGGLDQSGAVLDGTVESRSLSLMADFQPWANGFRLSGGLATGGYALQGTAAQVTLDGDTYTGAFDLNFSQDRQIAPVLSLGYSRTFDNGLTLLGEVGGKFVGYSLSAVPTTPLGAAQAQFDSDLAAVNSELDKLRVTPFVTIGVGLRF